jgi:hypothetical protein
MPWFRAEQRVRKTNTNPICNKTRSILDIFQRDPVTVKRWIRCASTAPAGFPSTEWDALVKGESIDIDTIFSSLHHIHSIDEVSDTLELLKYSLEDLNPPQKLKRVASGPQRSISSLKQLRFCSPIDMTNSGSMKTIWKNCSPQNQSQSTQSCSNTMRPSDTRSDRDKTFCLPTEDSPLVTTKQSLPQTVSDLRRRAKEAKEIQERAENLGKDLKYAIDSMEQRAVAPQLKNANINTFARNVNQVDMEKWNARSMRECEELGVRPRYLRYNLYRNDEKSSRSCSEWTEVASPLASVPVAEYSNTFACRTIDHHPGLFTVNTPINVDEFENLLTRHPNCPFVKSVINGFRHGFWPWAC